MSALPQRRPVSTTPTNTPFNRYLRELPPEQALQPGEWSSIAKAQIEALIKSPACVFSRVYMVLQAAAMGQLSQHAVKLQHGQKIPIGTKDVAAAVGITIQNARRTIAKLETHGLCRRDTRIINGKIKPKGRDNVMIFVPTRPYPPEQRPQPAMKPRKPPIHAPTERTLRQFKIRLNNEQRIEKLSDPQFQTAVAQTAAQIEAVKQAEIAKLIHSQLPAQLPPPAAAATPPPPPEQIVPKAPIPIDREPKQIVTAEAKTEQIVVTETGAPKEVKNKTEKVVVKEVSKSKTIEPTHSLTPRPTPTPNTPESNAAAYYQQLPAEFDAIAQAENAPPAAMQQFLIQKIIEKDQQRYKIQGAKALLTFTRDDFRAWYALPCNRQGFPDNISEQEISNTEPQCQTCNESGIEGQPHSSQVSNIEWIQEQHRQGKKLCSCPTGRLWHALAEIDK